MARAGERRKLQRVTCVVVALAAAVAALGLSAGSLAAYVASAAKAPTSPLAYVLRPPDFPAKADPVDAGPMPASFARKLRGLEVVGRAAQYFANIPFGPERSQTVYGLVVSTPSVEHARTVYDWQRRTAMRRPKGASRLRLPRFGDEQVAFSSSETDSGRLLVRRGTVVWRLEIGVDGELSLSPARVRDELEKYAAKQRARIG